MATNPYNQPNAVNTAGSRTYSKSAVKAGTINPYDDFGAKSRDSALADQKMIQAQQNAADAKQRASDLAAQVAQQKAQAEQQKAQQVKDSQPKKSTASKVVSALGGIGKGAANIAGGIVVGGAEAINKGIVKPYISSPAAAVGGAAADATSGKGFDYRKQYQLAQNEENPLATGTKFVDKKLGTNLKGSVDYADQHTKEILATTGLVLADIGSGGLLTPVVAPALTAYYAPKYAKTVVPTIKAMQAEPDLGKKFTMGTELLGQALLLAKGAKDTVTSVRGLPGQLKGIPTTKEVNVGGTVGNEQARSFFNSSNPDISPETSALLGKALADNKSQFVSELKAGKGVTVENIQTVPTVYGKLINIIKAKLDKGQKLTPNEEGVVQAVATNPAEFVKTKEMVPYDAAKARENAVPPAAGVAPINPAELPRTIEAPTPAAAVPAQAPSAVLPAPTLAPIELPPGLAHPNDMAAPVAPTVEAPAPPKGSLKPINQPAPHPAAHLADERAFQSGFKPFTPLDTVSQAHIDKLVTSAQNKPVPTGSTRLYQTNDSVPGFSDQYFKDIDVLANYINGRSDNATLRMVDVPNNQVQTVPGKPEVFKIKEEPIKPSNLESNRMKGAVKPLGKKPTVEIKYPATSKLPAHLKDKAPLDMKKLQKNGEQAPKEKLSPGEANKVAGTDIHWNKSKLSELVRLVPGLKEKPVLTVYKDSEGDLQFHGGSNDKSQTFRIPAESMGLSKERIQASGLKVGDTVDLGGVLEKGGGQVPVIKKGKTMFSGTSGGNKAAPKAEPAAPKAEAPPAPEVPKAKPSNPVKKFLDETAKNKEVAGKLDDQLHALGGNSIADNIALNKLFKETKKLDLKPEDWTAVYHYAEDRNSPATPEQKALYDTTIQPLQESINSMRTDMGLKPFKNDEFIHRIAQGRGSSLERYLEGDTKDIGAGNILKKTSDSMKSRTWMKLVDPNDPRSFHIVSIKSPKNKLGKALGERQVTAYTYGKKTPMGALKRKIPTPTKEFGDPVLKAELEKIAQGLGIEHTRTNMPLKRGDTAAGVHYGGTNVVKTRAASAPDVLLHEIGHFIDHKYDLQGQFLGRIKDQASPAAKEEQRTITQELRALADKRIGAEGAPKSFSKYVRTGEEKMAVMFQAYLHAPEIFKAVAPVTYDKFDAFLRSNPETKPIANIEKSLQLASETIGDVRHEGEFIDKTGKKWKIVNATTKEIETNSNTRYYKQPLVSTAIDYMQTRQALRASQFLDKWKESPDFLYQEHPDGTTTGIAVKSDTKNIPDGWKTTTAMQFKGYYFEPRTAEVLDDFARTAAKGDPLGAFTGMNLFLRNTIFFNPLMHVPNIAVHALMRRGLSGIVNPIRLVRATTTSIQALNEVLHKGTLYQELLREGAPLMSFDRTGLTKMIGKMMEDTIQDDKAVSTLAKLTGYADKANFIKAWYKVSSGITWGSHDFFMLQAMIEEMKRGLTPQEAIHEVTGHIPDYRLPTRFAGSRSLKTTLANHNVTMFLPYHYGILKSYANTVREMAGTAPRGGRQEEGFTGHAKISARGLDKLLMFGVIMFIIYPELDKLAKKITGDSNSIQRRAGVATFPYAIYRMLAGKRSIQSTATLILPTPPGSKGAIQLLRNRDDLNRQIWNPGDAFSNPVQAAKDIVHFVGGTVAPVQQAQRAQKGQLNLKQFGQNLIGISTPNDTKALVSKLYSQQINLGVQSKEQQRINDRKNAARDQIAAGKGDSLAKQLVADGIIKQIKLKAFKDTASWTPMQRTFDNLSASNKLQVFQSVPPKDWTQLGDLKQIQKDAAKTAGDKNASAENRTAAGDIQKLLSGDKANMTFTTGQKTNHQSVLQSIGAYASAFGTSPMTAFNRIFTGQRIVGTANGAIIVERMPLKTSAGIRTKLGANKNAVPMQLDHIVPLELGGSNAMSNLQLIPKTQDEANNPVENYLGKLLKANKINAKTATKLILDYKQGKITADDVYKH